MPAPTRSLTVADVHRFVDEQVFRTSATDGPTERQVGIELEWIAVARDGAAVHARRAAARCSPTSRAAAGSRSSPAGSWS